MLARLSGIAFCSAWAAVLISPLLAAQSAAPAPDLSGLWARTYIGLATSELVLTIPGGEFATLVERLETTVAANAALALFHQQQKVRFSA